MNISKVSIILMTLFICFVFISDAYAAPPYESMTYDKYGNWVPVQAPYIANKVIEYITVEDESGEIQTGLLSAPSDIFIANDDTLYVTDTNNHRVIHMDSGGAVIKFIPCDGSDDDAKLRSPQGVFVTDDGSVYVADTDNKRIAIFDKDGVLVSEILPPESEYLPIDYSFYPIKVIVDDQGYIYVITKAGYYGLTQLSPEGEYETIFGANKVKLNAFEQMRRIFYTKEQLSRVAVKLPGTITNVFLGKQGYIHTCTANLAEGQVKRFNYSGSDTLAEKELEIPGYEKSLDKPYLIDLTVDNVGNITCLDSVSGLINIYDIDGEPLFSFGGIAADKAVKGLFGYPSSLSYDSKGNLYVVDSKYNNIHIFEPTEFGSLVFNAIELYNDGLYVDSLSLWEKVLELNANFYRANLGIGKAKYKQKDWSEASLQFKESKTPLLYSNAFLKQRLEWTQKHFGTVAMSITILFFSYSIVKRIIKVRQKRSMSIGIPQDRR